MKLAEHVHLVGSGEVGISNPLDCHVYLLGDKRGLAIIDAGAGVDSQALITNIKNEGFSPEDVKYLIITHCHSDHASGAADIKALIGCQVLASAEETPYIQEGDSKQLGLDVCKKANWYPQDFKYKHCKIDRPIRGNDVLTLPACNITSLILQGHSYGVLCLIVDFGAEGRRAFFSSDTVFMGGTIGLGNWPGSSLEAYRENIHKVRGLDVDELYPGHGLWTLREGQKHLDKALDNLSYGWVPPIGSHNHPVY